MYIFTFNRYGNILYQYFIRFFLILIHYIEIRFILKKKTLLFHKVGIIWSIVEFFLVFLKKRILKNENIITVIFQSLLRGYSEGGVFTSIAFNKSIISGILLILSSYISSC